MHNRPPIGWDGQDRKFYCVNTDPKMSFKENKRRGALPLAVTVNLPPAYISLYLPANETIPGTPPLPLLATAALYVQHSLSL